MKGEVDSRKPLQVLNEEWAGCVDCSLGELRELRNGQQVVGGGTSRRGVMFIGEAPGSHEEREGRPVGGKAGSFLAKLLTHFRIRDFYVTNLVSCRSCAPMLDDRGSPILTRGFAGRPQEPRYKDQPTLRPQVEACSRRLHEEIYLIDPVLIVSLGQPAAQALIGGTFNLKRERGKSEIIEIPGAGVTAVLSPKKREWVRKVHGNLVAPTERSKVRYLMLPTHHPAEVRAAIHYEQKGSLYQVFTDDLRKAKKIYESYNEELYGNVPEDMSDLEHTPYELADVFQDEDEEERHGDQ